MSLIGVKNLPDGYAERIRQGRMSRAYYQMSPYPMFGFSEWKTDQRGPLPRCLPHAKLVIDQHARTLFGKPVTFVVPGDKNISDLLNEVWNDNNMGSAAVNMAVMAGCSGAVVLKWSYERGRGKTGVSIQVLDAFEHCRLYFDPLDPSKLLMMRVQFPYYDAETGKVFWRREDWTDDVVQYYKPLLSEHADTNKAYGAGEGDSGKWECDGEPQRNEFGVVPGWVLCNTDDLGPFGTGTLTGLFQVIDLVNFTYSLIHTDNQLSIKPHKVYIDLDFGPDEAPSSAPDSTESLKSDSGKDGKVQLLETSGSIREHVRQYAQDLTKMFYQSVGAVDGDMTEVTNKGSLSAVVMEMLYLPLVQSVRERQKTFGEDGLAVFMERLCRGMAKSGGGFKEVEDVQVVWPDILDQTEEEKMLCVSRYATMLQEGFTTRDRAIRIIAGLDGNIDIDDIVKEAIAEHPDNPRDKDNEPDEKADQSGKD